MYELIQVANNTYYVNCPAKIGVYRCNDTDIFLIDSGNDKDAGRKVRRVLQAEGWQVKAILNTHSHADHTGGNRYFQQNTGCNQHQRKRNAADAADLFRGGLFIHDFTSFYFY